MELQEFFQENPKVAVAFSGGVDSSFLLYAAKRDAKEVRAYYVQTAFQPRFETEEALRTAEMIGVPVSVLSVDVLADSFVTSNPSNPASACAFTFSSVGLSQMNALCSSVLNFFAAGSAPFSVPTPKVERAAPIAAVVPRNPRLVSLVFIIGSAPQTL